MTSTLAVHSVPSITLTSIDTDFGTYSLLIPSFFIFFTMLSSLVKEHHAKQSAHKERQEQKRKEAIGAANNLTQALVDHLNVGVAQAYLNQKRLDAEAKQLHNNATNFAKQTQQWLSLVENFNSALKEIGDAENWARSIESDMRTITSALDHAYKATQETPAPFPSQ